jgi:serine phosphatase RsbU (regulator of sigma subunit)
MCALLTFARRKPDSARPVLAPVPELQDAQLAAVYYDQRVGGDCYAFLRPNPHRVLFALIDVAGRSQENRPVVAAVQSALQSGSALLAGDNVNEAEAMVELCLRLNDTILETAHRVCSSPAFIGCYNESLGTVSYFNAGHTPGLLRDGSQVIELRATGLPLGLFSHATPDASIVALEPGDALVVVSRGVVEARHRRREFGLEQVMTNLLKAQAETAPQICSHVLADLREFTRKPEAQNDVTILALARKPAAKAASV